MKSTRLFGRIAAGTLMAAGAILPSASLAATSVGAGLTGGVGVSNDMAKVNVTTGVEVDGNGSMTTGAGDANAGATAGGNTAGHSILSSDDAGSANLVITSKDAKEVMYANDMESTSVVTNDDFATYAKGQMQTDADLKQVETSADSVTVQHAVSGRLFGIFPISLTATTVVDANGTVAIHYPWYRFLVATDNDYQAAIQDKVSAALSARAHALSATSGGGSALTATSSETAAMAGGFTAAERARILADIEAGFRGNANATAGATANGTAQTGSGY